MTIQDYRLLIESILLVGLVLWVIKMYSDSKRASRERKNLVEKMNAWGADMHIKNNKK